MKDPYERRLEIYEQLEGELTFDEFEKLRRELSSVTLQIETENNIGTKDYRSDKSQTSSLNKGGNKPRMRQ